jgi:hypothetical protein
MSDPAQPEENKEVKETPRSTAEVDFTKYKVCSDLSSFI